MKLASYRLRFVTPNKAIYGKVLFIDDKGSMIEHRTTAKFALAKARNISYCAEVIQYSISSSTEGECKNICFMIVICLFV
jgi:hypothetical protein